MILQRYTFGSKSQHDWFTLRYRNVAYDIAKIYIWKQITTVLQHLWYANSLLMILQRYTFGSKSQQPRGQVEEVFSCLWYCKDIHLEANHNGWLIGNRDNKLLMILQRYTFGSKSQHWWCWQFLHERCLWYCKDR